MPEYAPAALEWLAGQITRPDGIASAQMSGIIGDSSHAYGYHRCRDVLPANDYSVTLPPDRRGDGEAASALDLSFGPADMVTVTQRLIDAGRARDPRVHGYVREHFGTVDGRTVTGWDNSTNGYTSSDDMSHLWHVHLSIYRQYATDTSVMDGIRDVILGRPQGEDDMPIRTSLGVTPVTVPWDREITLSWGTEYADPQHAHANPGAYPGYVAPFGSNVDVDVLLRVTGMQAGDEYGVTAVNHAWNAKKNAATGTPAREPLADYPATSGDQYIRARGTLFLDKSHHLYIALALYRRASPASAPAPRVLSGTWRIAQDRAQ